MLQEQVLTQHTGWSVDATGLGTGLGTVLAHRIGHECYRTGY